MFEFILKLAWSSIFAIFIFFIFFISGDWSYRFDILFLWVILFQFFLYVIKWENLEDIKIIFIFHFLAMIMEIFKTSPAISSWHYPEVGNNIFVIYTVPLFAGFMYSAVGSFIAKSWDILDLKIRNKPNVIFLFLISFFIYINFFIHHFIFDFRYILIFLIFFIFKKTKISLKKWGWNFNFLYLVFFLSFLVWVAENISTYFKIWIYPNQIQHWQMVSFHKITSWFLLLVLSYSIFFILHRKFKEK